MILSDRFRINELRDRVDTIPLEPRVDRWSESSADIRAVRKIAKDGPLSCDKRSRLRVAASLSAVKGKTDDAGNSRLIERGTGNEARDDVATALCLASGADVRALERPRAWRD